MADGTRATEQWFTTADLAGLPGMPKTERGVRKWAVTRAIPSRKKAVGKGLLYPMNSLPSTTQVALTKSLLPQEIQDVIDNRSHRAETAWQHYRRCPENMRKAADYRASILRDLRALRRTGVTKIASREIVAQAECDKGHAVSAATIARWEKDVLGQPAAHWPAFLVPKYIGRTVKAEIEPMAWEIFKADYLRLEKPSASACYFRLQRIAADKGWSIT